MVYIPLLIGYMQIHQMIGLADFPIILNNQSMSFILVKGYHGLQSG